jgi:PAS domain-containing protein
MKDNEMTKELLQDELEKLRQQIAELKKAEKEHIQTEKRLRIMDYAVASSINAVGITDLNGKLIYVNDSCVKMWGYDNEKEILGRSLLEFWEGEGRQLK